jgi:cytochrome c-type biogenesis protein CcmE
LGEISLRKQLKFGVGIGVILISLGCLAWLGARESKTYYHTIAELGTLHGSDLHQRMRIGGTVRPGSIQKVAGRVDFVLGGEGNWLVVSYVGADPLPDTFVDNTQALVEGRLAPDGRFIAEKVQAKCASKYEAAPSSPARPDAPASPDART